MVESTSCFHTFWSPRTHLFPNSILSYRLIDVIETDLCLLEALKFIFWELTITSFFFVHLTFWSFKFCLFLSPLLQTVPELSEVPCAASAVMIQFGLKRPTKHWGVSCDWQLEHRGTSRNILRWWKRKKWQREDESVSHSRIWSQWCNSVQILKKKHRCRSHDHPSVSRIHFDDLTWPWHFPLVETDERLSAAVTDVSSSCSDRRTWSTLTSSNLFPAGSNR